MKYTTGPLSFRNPGDPMTQAVGHFSKPKTNDFLDTTALWGSTTFPVAKAGYVFIDVLKEADLIPEGCEKEFSSVRHHLNLIKLSSAPGDFLKNTNALRHAISNCLEQPSFKSFKKVVRKALNTVAPIWNGTDFLSKVEYISKDAPLVQNLKGINSCTLVASMSWTAWDKLNVIHDSKLSETTDPKLRREEFTKVTAALLDLVKSVSYVCLGVLTALTVFFGYVFAPVTFVALSATSVVFSILGFYHKNWGAERKEEK